MVWVVTRKVYKKKLFSWSIREYKGSIGKWKLEYNVYVDEESS